LTVFLLPDLRSGGGWEMSITNFKKSFAQAFSKACGVKGQSPCRPPQWAKLPYRPFFLRTFSLGVLHAKKKWTSDYSLLHPADCCTAVSGDFCVPKT